MFSAKRTRRLRRGEEQTRQRGRLPACWLETAQDCLRDAFCSAILPESDSWIDPTRLGRHSAGCSRSLHVPSSSVDLLPLHHPPPPDDPIALLDVPSAEQSGQRSRSAASKAYAEP